ncbi:MAG: HEAT repeat domain-containing protein [Candidatus Njordarchaeota archaeon]
MQIKYLERWLKSPYPGRRRKALRTLSKYATQGKYKPEKIFPIAINALKNDSDWQVRSSAASSIADIALTYNQFLDDAFKTLIEKIKDESHANVKGNIFNSLSKLIDRYDIDDLKSVYDLCLNAIKDPNSEIKHGAIRVLVSISLKQEKNLEEVLGIISDTIESLPSLIKKETIRLLSKIYDKYPEKTKDMLSDMASRYVTSDAYLLREETLKIIAKLIKNDHINITEDLIRTLRKQLRDPKTCVKMATIDAINAIWKKNIETADLFLDIIAEDILLKSKSRQLKIKTLELLIEHIQQIPRPVINRHNLARVLDILEYNTVPKNELLKKIKSLARILLEEKLGYTFEERKRLREQ